jgi:hypothetical protein
MPIIPNTDGVSNDPGGGSPAGSGGGGGAPPTAPNLANLPVVGGLLGLRTQLLVPGFDDAGGQDLIYEIDPTNHNCEEDCEYQFKVEEVEPGNELTIHRIVIRYRDLGVVTFTIAVVSAIAPIVDYTPGTGNAELITVGNVKPTNKIYTYKSSMRVTTEAPQLVILRKANAGPLAICKVRAWGSYGDGDII